MLSFCPHAHHNKPAPWASSATTQSLRSNKLPFFQLKTSVCRDLAVVLIDSGLEVPSDFLFPLLPRPAVKLYSSPSESDSCESGVFLASPSWRDIRQHVAFLGGDKAGMDGALPGRDETKAVCVPAGSLEPRLPLSTGSGRGFLICTLQRFG